MEELAKNRWMTKHSENFLLLCIIIGYSAKSPHKEIKAALGAGETVTEIF
jgi:hypothetical protein